MACYLHTIQKTKEKGITSGFDRSNRYTLLIRERNDTSKKD